MLILCSIHTNRQLLDVLLENLVALKVLVWSRGRLVTLQIPTSPSFSLAEDPQRLTALRANVSPFPLLMYGVVSLPTWFFLRGRRIALYGKIYSAI